VIHDLTVGVNISAKVLCYAQLNRVMHRQTHGQTDGKMISIAEHTPT